MRDQETPYTFRSVTGCEAILFLCIRRKFPITPQIMGDGKGTHNIVCTPIIRHHTVALGSMSIVVDYIPRSVCAMQELSETKVDG